jgi:hypothetical protein
MNMDMSAQKYRALAGALGVVVFLTACGDLGMVFPSQGSYRVNAQVDGDYTLDTYSVVTKNSKISPYFVNSVISDPDVRGLTVFVQDYSGAIVSRKVQYQLAVNPLETPEPEDGLETPAPAAPSAENEAAKPGGKEPEAGDSEKLPGVDLDDPQAKLPADSLGDAGSNSGAPAETGANTSGGANTAHASDAGKDPAGATPAGTRDAQKTDAANKDGADKNTGDTEPADKAPTGAAGSAASVPATASRPPIPEDEIVPVTQLDQYLPAFQIVEELDIGRHSLVFHVMGEKEILYKTYKPIYFIGDAKFTLGEIQSFLPVTITGGQLIPPGIKVMLETEISADPRLDPYIIWHNGKKTIAQGRLSEGANYLLWETPEQTGFHGLRAEVFPLLPGERMPENMLGKIKELSLPVSSKSEGLRRFNDSSDEFASWYQLWGTLDDARAKNNPERRLIPLNAQTPRWTPQGGMYGLLVGPNDMYALPGMPFKLSGYAQGTGRMRLHLAALSEGPVFTIRFAGGEIPAQEDRGTVPPGTAELELFLAGNALGLRIASGDASREEFLALQDDGAHSFIIVSVEFTLAQDHLDAELLLGNSTGTTGLLSIPLAAPISGEGALHFGGSGYSGHERGAQQPASGEAEKYNGTMILNELALSYVRLPFPNKEEEAGSGLPETASAAEEDPGAEPEQSLNTP